jgi:hypothetical protein
MPISELPRKTRRLVMQNIFLDGVAGIVGAVMTILFSCFVATSSIACSKCNDVEFEDD